jgi:hypothetical protein
VGGEVVLEASEFGQAGKFCSWSAATQSFPNSSFPSSQKLIRTTTAEPASPTKNISSIRWMMNAATIMLRL